MRYACMMAAAAFVATAASAHGPGAGPGKGPGWTFNTDNTFS